MSPTRVSNLSPAENLLDALEELNQLCDSLRALVDSANLDAGTAMHLKTVAEYRHLLKFRIETLRKARTLLDEACFQKAVLKALRGAGEEVYRTAVKSLWQLESAWPGYPDDPDGDPDDDNDDDNADDESNDPDDNNDKDDTTDLDDNDEPDDPADNDNDYDPADNNDNDEPDDIPP